MTRWAILTGEYPPQQGGVSDYTRLVARQLAGQGDSVHVYCPCLVGQSPNDPSDQIHCLRDHFGVRSVRQLGRELQNIQRPFRILIQYVPHAYGWKAMNLPFVAWVAFRATRIAPVWVMFHEVMYPIIPGQSWRHAILGRVNRLMARLLARCAERVFVSIPAWGDLLKTVCRYDGPVEWLPVPSNVPSTVDSVRVASIRHGMAPGDQMLLGHFGTFGSLTAGLLGSTFAAVLRNAPDRLGVFIGRGSVEYRDQFIAEHGDLASRILATGWLPAEEAAAHLAACDVLVQPYPDGASSRRGSLMSGLALGVPTVTNIGKLSEPVWGTESAGVTVSPTSDAQDIVAAAESLLSLSANERAERGRASAAWYRSLFALEHTIGRLRGEPLKVATSTSGGR